MDSSLLSFSVDRNSLIPLYAQLAQYLKDAILQGVYPSGEQLPSENEIASKFHLSRMTVRNAFSMLEKEHLIMKIQGKGTFAFTQNSVIPRNIDVLLDISYTYFAVHYIRSISDVLARDNCRFIIHDTLDSQAEIARVLNQVARNDSAGVILQPSHQVGSLLPELREAFMLLDAKGIPFIMLDHAYDDIPGFRMVFDDYGGGKTAAEHLVSLGHKSCAMVSFPSFFEHRMRRDGFNEVLAAHGLPPLLEIDVEDAELVDRLREAILTRKITAVFCFNDEAAIRCMRAIYAIGLKIPEDISVVGYDDTVVATATNPPLTSVIHPKEVLGRMAAEKLNSLIKGLPYTPDAALLKPKLHIRASCAVPRIFEDAE